MKQIMTWFYNASTVIVIVGMFANALIDGGYRRHLEIENARLSAIADVYMRMSLYQLIDYKIQG